MDAQRSIYPQRVRKKSVGQFRGLSRKLRESMRCKEAALEHWSLVAKYLKTRPREYRKWMRSVRFTPRGSEKRALGNFMSVRVHRAMERELQDT